MGPWFIMTIILIHIHVPKCYITVYKNQQNKGWGGKEKIHTCVTSIETSWLWSTIQNKFYKFCILTQTDYYNKKDPK